ncbi:MAG: cache domain-containing protein [Acidobacteriota bacterium]
MDAKVPLTGAAISAVALALAVWSYDHDRRGIFAKAQEGAWHQAEQAAEKINTILARVVPVNEALIEALQGERWDEQSAYRELERIAHEHPFLFGVGIAYAPAPSQGARLDSFYVCKDLIRGGHRRAPLRRDYTVEPFYRNPVEQRRGVWQEPHYGKSSQTWIANYSAPIFAPSAPNGEPIGVAFVTLSLDDYREILTSLDLGDTGYGFILSQEFRVIAHLRSDYLGRELMAIAKTLGDASLEAVVRLARQGQGGPFDYTDRLTQQKSWIFFEPIATTGWSLGVVFLKQEMAAELRALKPRKTLILVAVVALLLSLIGLDLALHAKQLSAFWRASLLTALTLLAGSIGQVRLSLYDASPTEHSVAPLVDQMGLDRFVERHGEHTPVSTGIFVQSLSFASSTDVELCGFVWQRLAPDSPVPPGFFLPEAIDGDIGSTEPALYGSAQSGVLGWHVQTTLRQRFDYKRYPFDQKHIWVRLRHADRAIPAILVPDLTSYDSTNPAFLPGLSGPEDSGLVLPGWTIERSFFGERQHRYSTSLGLEGTARHGEELYFNIILRRRPGSVLIGHFVPLFVVLVMLFGMLTSTTRKSAKNTLVDFSFWNHLGSVSGLFFVAALAHNQLRREVPEDLIYLEYFYFIVYLMILASSINAFLVASGAGREVDSVRSHRFYDGLSSFVSYQDNLAPKLLFWPVVMAMIFAVTLWTFYA